ncbi:hypothetical protein H5410_013394 [Solanum commersonii]|uniref:Uncharacterized protein n=1 Tax=Solanum commersonii TaxID=4109 RepID=A0A9J6AUH8_SOLCO|nr:hypothetical protein H5410_013394 [Solanum commersonii]
MILSATLQFTPKDIIQISNEINYELLTKFHQISQSQPPQPKAPYVIALEISQLDLIDYSSYCSDLDDEEELHTAAHILFTTDYINDPYHKYLGDVLEYLYALREYTGEGGIFPAKSLIAEDLPKGLEEIKRSLSRLSISNSRIQ